MKILRIICRLVGHVMVEQPDRHFGTAVFRHHRCARCDWVSGTIAIEMTEENSLAVRSALEQMEATVVYGGGTCNWRIAEVED